MANANALIEELKAELSPVEHEIRTHRYLGELEAGRVPREKLRLFAGEQYHIIRSDLRSVALLVNRFGATASGSFFQGVLVGEGAALEALGALALAVEMNETRLQAYEPTAGAQAYPAFMAWLALYGSDAEVAAGYLVNFAAWGASCGRMSQALRSVYGLTPEQTRFFDLFAAPPGEFEPGALAVVEGGLARGADPRLIKRAARLLQSYEKLYWDTIHEMSRGR
ncbi:MAG: transcriptional regulator [Candidatus Methylomirabilia bacterium]